MPRLSRGGLIFRPLVLRSHTSEAEIMRRLHLVAPIVLALAAAGLPAVPVHAHPGSAIARGGPSRKGFVRVVVEGHDRAAGASGHRAGVAAH